MNLQPETPGVRGLDDFALACRRVGQPLVRCGGTWWREVRPCFFRPFLPFLDVPAGPAGLPYRAVLGGYQYPSRAGGEAPNSLLAYLTLEDARNYSLDCLSPRLQRYVRSAEKRFVIRPLSKVECKAGAHPVYLEFRHRTRYAYLKNRVRKPDFDRWVEAEFADPGLVALGAWAGHSLVAVGLSRVVGAAWVYTSFFAADEALRGHVANQMLHHVRSLAAAVDGVSLVFVGMQKPTGTGAPVDEFYFRRGATLIQKPAVLHVNPLVRWMLSRLRPGLWGRLRGGVHDSCGVLTPSR